MSSNLVFLLIFAVAASASTEFPQDLIIAVHADNKGIINETQKLVDTQIDGRIVGGFDSQPGQFPYLVSFRVNNQHICGGSIVNQNNILTAAHCVEAAASNINDATIVTGTVFLNQGGNSNKVISMYYYTNYPGYLDFGVVRVSGSIDYNNYQQPIPLATNRPPGNSRAVTSGWGLTSTPPGSVPNGQQYLYVNIIDTEQCRSVYSDITTEICTLNAVNQGVCSGDSGGPLVYNGQLVAVTSRAVLCAKGYPDIFGSVPNNMDNILRLINSSF
ncbi:chymotrypsin-1-like [Colletes gigas]|uniref:chymotrypsin-1-like n=1 Tax=Colletes gigas TaxID=935657 RepID=UPI001C9BB83B|nr:chymotrypsin-1-like [Colletes gigas]